MANLILSPQQISASLENHEGELRLDSRIIASGFGLPNHTSYRTNVLMKYESELSELGVILKMTLDNGEIAWYLNQAQVNFAGTLARNTEKAVKFKLNLVKAFEMAKQTISEYQAPTQPQVRQLAPQRDLIDYIEALNLAGVLDSPILKALITQRAAEQLGGNALPATQQVICTVRAHELGYSQKQIGNGSALGSFVVKQGCEPTGKTYHGNYKVNTYELTPELDQAICLYFS
jgi:hypothetical protein